MRRIVRFAGVLALLTGTVLAVPAGAAPRASSSVTPVDGCPATGAGFDCTPGTATLAQGTHRFSVSTRSADRMHKIRLPFSFDLGAGPSSVAWVSAEGFVTFATPPKKGAAPPTQTLPSATGVTDALYPLASPSTAAAVQEIRWAVSGTTGNHHLVIEWLADRPRPLDPGTRLFGVRVDEAGSSFAFFYGAIGALDGSSALVGFAPSTSVALQLGFQQPILTPDTSIEFAQSGTILPTNPHMTITTPQSNIGVTAGGTTTSTVTITNDGDAPLDYYMGGEALAPPPIVGSGVGFTDVRGATDGSTLTLGYTLANGYTPNYVLFGVADSNCQLTSSKDLIYIAGGSVYVGEIAFNGQFVSWFNEPVRTDGGTVSFSLPYSAVHDDIKPGTVNAFAYGPADTPSCVPFSLTPQAHIAAVGISPASGHLEPGQHVDATLTIDAAGLAPGVYYNGIDTIAFWFPSPMFPPLTDRHLLQITVG